jgi:hypothetical protein
MGATDDRGQVVPFGAMVLGIGVAVAMALAGLAHDAVDAVRARTAADGAALAGVVGGEPAARRVAAVNGGVLVTWAQRPSGTGTTVTVTVRVDEASATAAATGG